MQITIIDVSAPVATKTAKGGYQSIEVTYKNESGQAQGKKLMSFSNPSVFKAVQELEKGSVVEVETFKDDNGYWQWKAIKAAGSAPAETTGKPAGRVTGSNYETPDERAKRQVYIVRQSSIGHAVSILTVGAKSGPKVDEVLSLAKQLEDYVFGVDTKAVEAKHGFEDFSDDIPL